jgi:tRNA threonylcarbamoyladenosine biosynthesis protein TsaE
MNYSKGITLGQIPQAAKDITKQLKGGEILALVGPLGSGKTTFTKALGLELKIKHKITSPTFILMQAFPFKLKGKKQAWLYHLDLYRTKNFKEVKSLGLLEIWGRSDTVTVIEWADKIKRHLPKQSLTIKFLGKP